MSKTAVISGVGSGLGAALVRKFASEGYQVGLLARSPDYIQELAEELLQEGVKALAVPTDITDPQQVIQSFARVREELGPVDVLINHAGNAAWKGFHELTPDEFELSWRVCAYGSFLCAKEVVGDMLSAGSGAILFTGATSSIRGRAGALAFSSAKFAVRGLAWALARELWPKGIHVAPRYHRRGAGYALVARERGCRGERTAHEYRRRGRCLLASGAAGQRCLGF